MKFAILGGDERMKILASLLIKDGHLVKSFVSTPIPDGEDFSDSVVILPLPAFRGGMLNAPYIGKDYTADDILRMTANAKRVLGGMTDASWIEDYYKREELLLKNAEITAECALVLLNNELGGEIRGRKILVVGFGRIGKSLARALRDGGAAVTVAARRESHFAQIAEMGCSAVHTQKLHGKVSGFDAIVNTVPYPVIDGRTIDTTKKDCVFIELASEPYGIDGGVAAEKRRYILAAGLPGKMMPEKASAAIRDTIYEILGEDHG